MKNKYNTLLNNIKIKYLFSSVLLFGSFIIILGIFHHYNFLTILSIILVMFAYFFLGQKQLDNELLSMDQFADSNYYLGFLFTLMSLGASLFILSNGTVDTSIFIDLIGQFGLSISTTIVGLSMRVYLTSFNPTLDSNIDSFNTIIFDKLSILRDHIHETIDQTKMFSNVIDEKINIFVDQTQRNIDEYNNKLYQTFDEEVTKNIFVKVAKNIEELQINQQKGFEDIYSNVRDIHAIFSEQNKLTQSSFMETIDESKVWVDKFSEEIQDVKNDISSSNADILISSKQLSNIIQSLPETFAKFNDYVNDSNAKLSALINEKNELLLSRYLDTQHTEEEKYFEQNGQIIKKLQESHENNLKQFNMLLEKVDNYSNTLINNIANKNQLLIEKYDISETINREFIQQNQSNIASMQEQYSKNMQLMEELLLKSDNNIEFKADIVDAFEITLKKYLESESKSDEKIVSAIQKVFDNHKESVDSSSDISQFKSIIEDFSKSLIETLKLHNKELVENISSAMSENNDKTLEVVENVFKAKEEASDKNSFAFWK